MTVALAEGRTVTEPITDGQLDLIARRAEGVYARRIAGTTRPDQQYHFVAIDVNSEDFEIHPNDLEAMLRLEARHPDAEVYLCRVGPQPAYEFGGGDADRFRER
jgi:hypothetical protein